MVIIIEHMRSFEVTAKLWSGINLFARIENLIHDLIHNRVSIFGSQEFSVEEAVR